jgi:hypothetical protein
MHKPNAAATLNSPFPQPKDDTFTISAISVLAAIIASILRRLRRAQESRLVAASGTLVNLVRRLLFVAGSAQTRLSVRWRLLLFLCLAFNLFDRTGYFFFSGVTILAPTFRNFPISIVCCDDRAAGANFSPFPTYDLKLPDLQGGAMPLSRCYNLAR